MSGVSDLGNHEWEKTKGADIEVPSAAPSYRTPELPSEGAERQKKRLLVYS